MLCPIDRVGIVVPARNEQALLPALLASLLAAAARCPVDVRIVVALDACSDGSEAAVRRAALHMPDNVALTAVELRASRVGTARALGAGALLADGPDGLWIANTDADCEVPRDWITRQLELASNGADAVAGTVTVADWRARTGAVRAAALRAYRTGEHRHVHGANLGVRAGAYIAAGGFAPVPSDEDVSLIGALVAAGRTVEWATDIPVRTSARRAARAPRGFAAYLDSLENLENLDGPRSAPLPGSGG
jgi:glycosyltransferase involved in cell wall biosynthesis